MKTLFDMSTGMILDCNRQEQDRTQSHAQNINLLPIATLQEVDNVTCDEQQIPPELAISDLSVFLKKMS